jgi:SulP family sulfate permease
VLTIERLSTMGSTRVRTVDPSGDPVVLTDAEQRMLDRAAGRVILFHLSGPMIFGVAQAISRESAALQEDTRVLIVDLAEVSLLSTTVTLALENVILDARQDGRAVILSGASEHARARLERVGVLSRGVEVVEDRGTALRRALEIAGAAESHLG